MLIDTRVEKHETLKKSISWTVKIKVPINQILVDTVYCIGWVCKSEYLSLTRTANYNVC